MSYLKNKEKYWEKEEWKEKYSNFLCYAFDGESEKSVKWYMDPYADPDSLNTNCTALYQDITTFLNIKEEELSKKLKEKFVYVYEPLESPYIQVKTDQTDNILFYLKTDQFGFSAPCKAKSHPYDSYILLDEDRQQRCIRIHNVAKWIFDSRSLGGCFVWPLDERADKRLDVAYNRLRGGSIKRKGGSYIQDRVDLTLLELKYIIERGDLEQSFYDKLILGNQFKLKANMKTWLEHFNGNFKNYVEFFCFDDFVDGNEIINILKDSCLSKENINVKEIYNDGQCRIDDKTLETMLIKLNKMIVQRSQKMECIVNSLKKTTCRKENFAVAERKA